MSQAKSKYTKYMSNKQKDLPIFKISVLSIADNEQYTVVSIDMQSIVLFILVNFPFFKCVHASQVQP